MKINIFRGDVTDIPSKKETLSSSHWCTGMLKDKQAKKAAFTMAVQQFAKAYVVDEIGDIYQMTVTATLVASITSAMVGGAVQCFCSQD